MTPDVDLRARKIVALARSERIGDAGTRRGGRGGLSFSLCGALPKMSRQEKRGY